MRKTIFLLVFIFSIVILCSHSVNSQWVYVSAGSGMENTQPTAILVKGNSIFVATEFGGVYLSTDSSAHWTQTSLTTSQLYALATDGTNIYAGGASGVFVSSNNGANWTGYSVNNQTVTSIAISGNYIFAGTYQEGVFLSTNSGVNWTQTSLNSIWILSLTVNGNYIFAGTSTGGLFFSTNNGSNWTHNTALNNLTIESLASSGLVVYAGTNNAGLYLTTNNGANWFHTSMNTQIINTIATLGTSVVISIPNSGGVWASTDYGQSWNQHSDGLNNATAAGFIFLNNWVYCAAYGSTNGVFRRSTAQVIGIEQISEQVPSNYGLSQNYPNPFNPTTTIKFDLPKEGNVILKVFDIAGSDVYSVNEYHNAGSYELKFDGTNLASGIYFYRIRSGAYVETKKMMLIK